MKKQHHISFNIPREEGERIRLALARIECDQWWNPPPNERGLPSFEAVLDSQDPRLEAVLNLAKQGEYVIFERIDQIYTDEELRSFPLLHLMVDRAEINPFGPSHGTKFDLSHACSRCGCGAVQVSAFYSPPKAFPKSGLICQSNTEYFVADRLADALRSTGIAGLELRQVLSHSDDAPLPWWQIIPEYTMPRMSSSTKGIIFSDTDPPCPICQRDGRYHTLDEPEQIAYAINDVDDNELPHVAQTWERFAKSYVNHEDLKRSRFANPAILIRPRVFDIFRTMKVKHARFTPVTIV